MTTIRLVNLNDKEHDKAVRVLLFTGNLVLSPPEGGALPEGVYTVPAEALRLLDQKGIAYEILDKEVSLPAYGTANIRR